MQCVNELLVSSAHNQLKIAPLQLYLGRRCIHILHIVNVDNYYVCNSRIRNVGNLFKIFIRVSVCVNISIFIS